MKHARNIDLRIGGLLALVLLTAGCDFDLSLDLFGDDPAPPDIPYRWPEVGHIRVLAPPDQTEIHLSARWGVGGDSCNSTFLCDSVLQATIRTDSYIAVDRVDILVASDNSSSSVYLGTVYHPESSTFEMPYFSPHLYDLCLCPFTSDTAHYAFYLILYSRNTQFYSYTTHVRMIFHDSTRTDSLPDTPRMSGVIQRPLDSALIVNWCDRSFDESYFLIYTLIADSLVPHPDTVQSAYWGFYLWHPLRSTRYSFWAAAHNACGTSPLSDTVSILTW